jgi:hypothetical protein
MHNYFAARQGDLTDENMAQAGFLDMLEKQDEKAMSMFQKRADRFPGPFSLLHVAILADVMKDNQKRDQALQQSSTTAKDSPGLGLFASSLQKAVQKGPDAEPDAKDIDAAIKIADPTDRITIFYLVGRWHQTRGDQDGATSYFRQSIFGFNGYNLDLMLAEDALRQLGVDPLELERAAAPAGQQISLEP